jgi:hypothetical protein
LAFDLVTFDSLTWHHLLGVAVRKTFGVQKFVATLEQVAANVC